MKLDKEHIAKKCTIGKTGDGRPIVYVLTHGGLHACFSKGASGEVETIAAAPHKGIMRYLAEQKDKDIEWNDEAHAIEPFARSEDYAALKKSMLNHSVVPNSSSSTVDLYLVYDPFIQTVEIEKAESIRSKVRSGDYRFGTVARLADYSGPITSVDDV